MNTAMPVLARLKYSVSTYIALAIAFSFTMYMSWSDLVSSDWEAPATLLFLGLLISYDVFHRIYLRPTGPRGVQDSVGAYIILILFFLLALAPVNIDATWRQCFCLWLLLVSPLRFSSGHRVTVLVMIPLFLFCVFLPLHNEIMLAVSHPFRIIATVISGFFLRLCGFNVSNALTVIRLEGVDLAVTDACSGIQQFEALLLLGYILAKHQQRRLIWRIGHYLFCIPAVIFANSIRLILIVMLYHWPVGESVLYSGWHEGLGYFQVLVAVLFMWLVGLLLGYATDPLKGKIC